MPLVSSINPSVNELQGAVWLKAGLRTPNQAIEAEPASMWAEMKKLK